jgi:hypothetical protein
MLAEWPGNQCHCSSPTGNKVSNKLRLMLPAWISQHSTAALAVKSTVIPSLQQNLNECKFGLHRIITLASEDIYVRQNGPEMDSSALKFPHSKKVTFVELKNRLEDHYDLGKLGSNGIRKYCCFFVWLGTSLATFQRIMVCQVSFILRHSLSL